MLSLISGFEETGPEQEWLNKAELLGFSVFCEVQVQTKNSEKCVFHSLHHPKNSEIFGRMESALWSDIFWRKGVWIWILSIITQVIKEILALSLAENGVIFRFIP